MEKLTCLEEKLNNMNREEAVVYVYAVRKLIDWILINKQKYMYTHTLLCLLNNEYLQSRFFVFCIFILRCTRVI